MQMTDWKDMTYNMLIGMLKPAHAIPSGTDKYTWQALFSVPHPNPEHIQAFSGRGCPLCLSNIFRLPIPNPNPIPNPISDPNLTLKLTTKNDPGMKLNIELYLKVDSLGTGEGL